MALNPYNPYYIGRSTGEKPIVGVGPKMLENPQKDDNSVKYWQRQNKDNELQLYCQSCCYRYPDCIFIDELHPYDTLAEDCPDFVSKDMYKGKSRAVCWKKRLQVKPDYKPLPDNLLFHPLYSPFVICGSTEYYMVVTKEKMYKNMEKKK